MEDLDVYAKPPLLSSHAKQTALGTFLGLLAWSALTLIVYSIWWITH